MSKEGSEQEQSLSRIDSAQSKSSKGSKTESPAKNSADYVASIESYFSKGLLLGEALEKQLIYTHYVTRATQTNWKWRMMAERWRHATIKTPSSKLVEEIMEKRAIAQELRYEMGSPLTSVTCEDAKEELEAKEESEVVSQEQPPVTSSAATSTGITAGQETLESKVKPTKLQTVKEVLEKRRKSSKEAKLAALNALYELRKCGIHDKRTDTSDLDFNPFDPDMRYTPIAKEPSENVGTE